MSRIFPHPLTIAMLSVLAFSSAVPAVQAQTSAREERAKRMAELGKGKDVAKQPEQKAALYPTATRVAPDAKASGKMVKQLEDLQALYEKQDMAGVLAKTDAIVAMPAAGPYEKSFAYSMAGNAAADMNDQQKAADYFGRAVAANGLDNDSHFNTMYNQAVILYGNEKYTESLAVMDRFMGETKSEKPEHQSFRAALLANLGRNDEAAVLYRDLVTRNPSDKRILMNAVAALQGADKFDQASKLLEDAYKRGMLTEERELRSLYIGYMNAERFKDAETVIEDGVAKGILKEGPDLAKGYAILAQNAYYKDNEQDAVRLYRKAAPMAVDGEVYLNLAKVLSNGGKKAEAAAAAQKALEKGVKKPDDAKRLMSR